MKEVATLWTAGRRQSRLRPTKRRNGWPWADAAISAPGFPRERSKPSLDMRCVNWVTEHLAEDKDRAVIAEMTRSE